MVTRYENAIGPIAIGAAVGMVVGCSCSIDMFWMFVSGSMCVLRDVEVASRVSQES